MFPTTLNKTPKTLIESALSQHLTWASTFTTGPGKQQRPTDRGVSNSPDGNSSYQPNASKRTGDRWQKLTGTVIFKHPSNPENIKVKKPEKRLVLILKGPKEKKWQIYPHPPAGVTKILRQMSNTGQHVELRGMRGWEAKVTMRSLLFSHLYQLKGRTGKNWGF